MRQWIESTLVQIIACPLCVCVCEQMRTTRCLKLSIGSVSHRYNAVTRFRNSLPARFWTFQSASLYIWWLPQCDPLLSMRCLIYKTTKYDQHLMTVDIRYHICFRRQGLNEYTAMSQTTCPRLILGLYPANERRRYFVTTSLIGWAQAYNQPWCLWTFPFIKNCYIFRLCFDITFFIPG